jgi:hypothetical protein
VIEVSSREEDVDEMGRRRDKAQDSTRKMYEQNALEPNLDRPCAMLRDGVLARLGQMALNCESKRGRER